MDDDDMNIEFIPTGDPVADRGDAMIRLARQVEVTKNRDAKGLLLAYMEKVYHSVKLPPMGQLYPMPGANVDQEGNA
jgi:hypothetical protein